MDFWQTLVIAFIPTLGVAATVYSSTRDFAVRRRLDGTDKFFEIVMLAHGRSKDRPGVGTAEQIAAIHLLGDFGKSERHLKNAARAALQEIGRYTEGVPEDQHLLVNNAVKEALLRLDRRLLDLN